MPRLTLEQLLAQSMKASPSRVAHVLGLQREAKTAAISIGRTGDVLNPSGSVELQSGSSSSSQASSGSNLFQNVHKETSHRLSLSSHHPHQHPSTSQMMRSLAIALETARQLRDWQSVLDVLNKATKEMNTSTIQQYKGSKIDATLSLKQLPKDTEASKMEQTVQTASNETTRDTRSNQAIGQGTKSRSDPSTTLLFDDVLLRQLFELFSKEAPPFLPTFQETLFNLYRTVAHDQDPSIVSKEAKRTADGVDEKPSDEQTEENSQSQKQQITNPESSNQKTEGKSQNQNLSKHQQKSPPPPSSPTQPQALQCLRVCASTGLWRSSLWLLNKWSQNSKVHLPATAFSDAIRSCELDAQWITALEFYQRFEQSNKLTQQTQEEFSDIAAALLSVLETSGKHKEAQHFLNQLPKDQADELLAFYSALIIHWAKKHERKSMKRF